ncbi:uncharacterized protein LOC128921309 [Zeugodacus cucurbitae]|uniref:uncharacterized protein LOC128921309 n=1 Tax=Zeugodacus cucurbitae TaxID=28588 RepID=UPI0023D964FA|nr:uncharacterized protein LOC128921309 [Zeugodacus cucurbitae]
MQQHIEKLTKQVDTTNELLRKLTTVQSANNALINAMSCRRKSTNKFPLKTDEALKELDKELEGNKEKYMPIIQDLLGHNAFEKSLHKIIAVELLLEYNYFGVKGKKSLKEFTHFNALLFECVKVEGFTESEYIHPIQKSIKLAKGRFFKSRCLDKKRKEAQPQN